MTKPERVSHVLVLEDDDDIREALVEALSLEGYSAAGTPNLAEAFEIVAVGDTDAVLVDLRLRNGELGSDFVRGVVNDALAPALLLVSASCELAEPLAEEFRLTWIKKPFDVAHLVGELERAISKSLRASQLSAPARG